MARESLGRRSLQALASWGVGKVVENWPAILFFLATGGGMSYLASISDWFKPFGPAGAVLFATLMLLLCALAYLSYGTARLRLAAASYSALKAQAGKINTLEPLHEHERINLSDLYHPFSEPIRKAQFQHCELFGPGNLVMQGCVLNAPLLSGCEVVIVRPNSRPIGVIACFENCVFLETSFFHVTFVLDRASWNAWPQELRDQIPVISEAGP